MARTVNAAFTEFLSNTVNLDPNDTSKARKSRDNLINNISDFSNDEDFFCVFAEHHLKYGSFERHSKIRPLDDIDLMICLSASCGDERRTYSEYKDKIYIEGISFDQYYNLLSDGTNYLNSTKVINLLIEKLSKLNDYSKADMHKNHEAATLKLISYTWNFDIVPCFYTESGFYLIPDGKGNWKRTDPRIDNDRTTRINQKHNGKLLDVIRLMKYWNNRKVTIRIPSYMLECMILSKYEKQIVKDDCWVDLEFRDLFLYLSSAIRTEVRDPKGIQGDLNTFSYSDRIKISAALSDAYRMADEASALENKNQEAAINRWRDVLGSSFPEFTD